jgi:thermostable 8-oxoguanine DNA glycosylase
MINQEILDQLKKRGQELKLLNDFLAPETKGKKFCIETENEMWKIPYSIAETIVEKMLNDKMTEILNLLTKITK